MALTALLTVCSGVAVTGDAVAAPAPDTVASPSVTWLPCDIGELKDVGVDELPGVAQCGTLAVPIDYRRPDGNLATLSLIRFPATGSKIGSLVLNPGGPGQSGVASAVFRYETLSEEIRQRFDLVGFDPRGVGLSTPAIRCNSGPESDALRTEPWVEFSPEEVDRLESIEKDFAARCLARMGEEFLANVGTVNVAHDLDRLRVALGEERLTYLGYSYGTYLGATYAEFYPDRVRAMILDGVVDPSADPLEFLLNQSAAFQRAFDEYAADCARDAECPLGTDPSRAVEAFHRLVGPLVTQPAPTEDPRGLGYADALTATDGSLYYPEYWSDLTEGLRELAGGRGDTLLELADFDMGRDESGQYDNTQDAQTAIRCVDNPPSADRASAVERDRRIREVAPYEGYGRFTGYAPLDWCAFWPVPPTSSPHQVSTPGLPPVLVVSTTGDPATPYQAGVDLSEDLHAVLLSYNGVQHTVVFGGNDCIDRHATDYLVSLRLPPPGAAC